MIKQVANNYYAHVSNVNELISITHKECIRDYLDVFNWLEFDIIKYNKAKHNLSLIQSPDWNEANEPSVGQIIVINMDTNDWKTIPSRKSNPQIYHNKWMFVSDDYKGFDIDKAKERTKTWNNIPHIKKHKSKIGYKSYWIQLLKNYNIDI